MHPVSQVHFSIVNPLGNALLLDVLDFAHRHYASVRNLSEREYKAIVGRLGHHLEIHLANR